MGRDPTMWLAAAVRTLLRRVEILEKEPDMAKRVGFSEAPKEARLGEEARPKVNKPAAEAPAAVVVRSATEEPAAEKPKEAIPGEEIQPTKDIPAARTQQLKRRIKYRQLGSRFSTGSCQCHKFQFKNKRSQCRVFGDALTDGEDLGPDAQATVAAVGRTAPAAEATAAEEAKLATGPEFVAPSVQMFEKVVPVTKTTGEEPGPDAQKTVPAVREVVQQSKEPRKDTAASRASQLMMPVPQVLNVKKYRFRKSKPLAQTGEQVVHESLISGSPVVPRCFTCHQELVGAESITLARRGE